MRPLSIAFDAAERLAKITSNLLAFSRRQAMASEPVNLNNFLGEGIIDLIRRTVGPSIDVQTTLSLELWPAALVDISQVETTLLNIVVNARDAMPHGGSIRIETANATIGSIDQESELQPGEYVMLSISDTGTGIPEDIRDRIFDPFFTTKESGKASGLGLSQVYGYMKQLGGGIHLESQVGHGTTVKLYFPRVISEFRPR
jgi:signal transduction histidine kinase